MIASVVRRALLLALLVAAAACQKHSGKEEGNAANVSVATGNVRAADPNVAPEAPPPNNVVFLSAFKLHQQPQGNEPMLRGGRVADTAEWPASFYAVFDTPRGKAACTAAMIGPKVMLTAAHCIPEDGIVNFVFAGLSHKMSCAADPDWLSGADPSADWGLCMLLPDEVTPFTPPPGFEYETVDTSPFAGMVGRTIILTGYGCISDLVTQDQVDGKYRIGLNTIDETSASAAPRRDPRYYTATGNEKNNLFTTDTGANICPGDSGGPAFTRSVTNGGSEYAHRRIVGVNSRVFFRDSQHTTYGSSLIASTGTLGFQQWAKLWLDTAKLDACGLRGALDSCRS